MFLFHLFCHICKEHIVLTLMSAFFIILYNIPVIFQSPFLQPVHHVHNCFSSCILFSITSYVLFVSIIFFHFFPDVCQLSCHLILLSYNSILKPLYLLQFDFFSLLSHLKRNCRKVLRMENNFWKSYVSLKIYFLI